MRVSEAQVHAACARLRFSEGLRRRWKEARGEAALQEASDISFTEGVRVPPTVLRELLNSPEEAGSWDPIQAQALGVWRALWEMERNLPALNQRTPATAQVLAPPAMLAQINRNVCSYLVASGLLPGDQVAVPRDPDALSEILNLSSSTRGSALERIARIWQLILTSRLFEVGSAATGTIYVKWLLATTGVEPTGVAILSRWPAQNRSTFLGFISDQSASAEQWVGLLNQCLVDGCVAGEEVARAVQAGVYPKR